MVIRYGQQHYFIRRGMIDTSRRWRDRTPVKMYLVKKDAYSNHILLDYERTEEIRV